MEFRTTRYIMEFISVLRSYHPLKAKVVKNTLINGIFSENKLISYFNELKNEGNAFRA